jgi:osmoprotectant transport system ATP-binding protein
MATHGVEFADVSFTVSGRSILRGVSLRVEQGTTTALLGRSGSGKTTLLRTVNALVTPTGGRVLVDGRDVLGEDVIALRRRIGYVIQETGLFPHMTVERNVGMALELAGRSREESRARAAEMVGMVGLPEDALARYPWQLSGGQRQRVGVARALANEPKVLLMDEPFGALDPLTRAEMQTMVHDLLQRTGVTTLIVTHDLDEALFLSDRVVLLENGAVVADLASGEVRGAGTEGARNEAMRKYVAATHREVQA